MNTARTFLMELPVKQLAIRLTQQKTLDKPLVTTIRPSRQKTTATKSLVIALSTLVLTGCASTHAKNPADPLESFNRSMYQFNDTMDKAVAKPVAKGYSAVMPDFGKIMVNNFFSNLDDVIITANDLLQFKINQAASDGSRFLINSTFGVLGLFNVANRLEKHNEDFGQTLGYWGIGSGPYIVLPVLGPSTLRDSVSLYADSRLSLLRGIKHMRTRNQMFASKAISRREQLLNQEKVLDEAAVDRYEFIRDSYLLRRKSQIYDGNPPRERYDDEEEDIKHEQVPIPNTPSAQQNNTPDARPVSTAQQQPAPATPQTGTADRHSTHKIWVVQHVGIR